MITTTARPARPVIPPQHLLDLADRIGLGAVAVERAWTDGDDVVFENLGGNRWRYCEQPDGAGRTGLLVEHSITGRPNGNGRLFTPRTTAGPNEPWELRDFTWVADRMIVPAGVQSATAQGAYWTWLQTGESPTQSNPPRTPWYPIVACFALWRAQAKGRMRGVSLREACDRSELCTWLRTEIRASGWLSEAALAELEAL